jgi:uncharacterized membrane protein
VASSTPDEVRVSDIARRVLVAVTLALIAAIVVGAVLLWPDHVHHRAASDAIAPDGLFDAVVTKVVRAPCEGGDATATSTCTTAHVRLREGPDDGDVIQLPQESDADVRLDVGDDIVVAHYADADPGLRYAYADRERTWPLTAIVVLVALIAVAVGRWRGLGALAALAAAVVVVTAFVLPALLDGAEPVLVALVGGGAVVVAVVFLRRGVNAGSAIATIGALVSLTLVTALAWGAVRWTHVTGRAADVDVLGLGAASARVQGIVVAGTVIGAAGIRCDLAVRQVAAVWGVRGAEPPASRVAVFRDAMRAGREGVASGITMLVLAYLGVVLPLLLVFTETHRGIVDALNSDVVAVEIVRALAGAAGLALSVPATTLLATWVIGTARPERRRDDPRAYRNRHERALWASAAAAAPTLPDRPDRALCARLRAVEPKPPVPRGDGPRSSTSTNFACSTRWSTSWAMRSPRCTW